jgi:hypothetical protein
LKIVISFAADRKNPWTPEFAESEAERFYKEFTEALEGSSRTGGIYRIQRGHESWEIAINFHQIAHVELAPPSKY